MLTIKRVTSENKDIKNLVNDLDTYLAKIDGEEHNFYHSFNGIQELHQCIILYDNNKAIGCGAIKKMCSSSYEIKRMYIHPEMRGKGMATRLLQELENWARELKAKSCLLETGKRMPDAIALYLKNGYHTILNYEPYVGIENSRCFKKKL